MIPLLQKLALFLPLLMAGCIISGLYGALHDQLTYTLSPDYFHAFKFIAFHIPQSLHNRAGAALVGWQATWWMGVLIGLPVLTLGLIVPDWRYYVKHSLAAFAVVALTALAVGLGALGYSYISIDADHLPSYDFPLGVDQVAFSRVGMMHNFSYIGGFVGILTAMTYLIIVGVRTSLRKTQVPSMPPVSGPRTAMNASRRGNTGEIGQP
jgi:hypothetical protein